MISELEFNHLHACSLNTTTTGSSSATPPCALHAMGSAVWFHLSTLPHKSFGRRPDGESSMFSKVFPPVSWDKRIGICSSASVLPVGVHNPIMKCHTICCSMVISYLFLHFLFLPCLFFTFTFISPPSLLPIYQHSYPILLYPFPSSVFLMLLLMQTQLYMALMVWFPRHRCSCKVLLTKKKFQIPLDLADFALITLHAFWDTALYFSLGASGWLQLSSSAVFSHTQTSCVPKLTLQHVFLTLLVLTVCPALP